MSFDLRGPTTGITQQLLVWLLPSYLDQPERACPVLTAFTGYPGTPEAYIRTFDIDRIVRDQVAQGQLREPIVVIPDVQPPGLDSECVPRCALATIVARHRPDVDIWFFSGGGDLMPLQSLDSFQPHVLAPTSLTTRITGSGGHRPDVWRPALVESSAWPGDASSYFVPVS